jgi:feruloyl esterase
MSRYGFAVTGNNGGHFSSTAAVTFINGSQFEDTLLDFASRANHVSVQLAEDVVDNFYGKTEGVRVASDNNRVRRYYAGSSVGAGRGLASMQVNPKDFHGYLLGPPTIGFMDMNIGQLATQRIHNKTKVGEGWFTQGALYGPIKETIIDQCDGLDGVKDGIISDPFDCKFKLEPALLCGGKGKFSSSNGTCLTQMQIDNVYNLYKDTLLDGKFVYPAYLPGLEDSASVLRGRGAKASGWTQLVVYKSPKLDPKFDPFADITYDALQKGKAADPGKFNADNPDLSAGRGGHSSATIDTMRVRGREDS